MTGKKKISLFCLGMVFFASTVSLGPGMAAPLNIREVDFKEILKGKLSDDVLEICAPEESGTGPIRILRIHYADLDGKQGEEAVVLAMSCMAGTGGADVFGVFRLSKTGEVVELQVDDNKLNFEEKDYSANLRGKMNFEIEGGKIVKTFPIYIGHEPNCCPEGGIRKFIYHWNGNRFTLHRVEDGK
jgi:hypothetical protein